MVSVCLKSTVFALRTLDRQTDGRIAASLDAFYRPSIYVHWNGNGIPNSHENSMGMGIKLQFKNGNGTEWERP